MLLQIRLSLPWATYFYVLVFAASLMFLFISTRVVVFLSVFPNDTSVRRDLHISFWIHCANGRLSLKAHCAEGRLLFNVMLISLSLVFVVKTEE